jgi:hypothetical protein
MDDIVKRLRKGDQYGDCKHDRCMCDLMDEAATEIEELKKRLHDREAEIESLNARMFNGRH